MKRSTKSQSNGKLSHRKGTKKKLSNNDNGQRIQLLLLTILFANFSFYIIRTIGEFFMGSPNRLSNDEVMRVAKTKKEKYGEEQQEFQEKQEEILYSTWHYPFIHIVNTRFMQFQPNLMYLLKARLHLFRAFCLPSMILQTSYIPPPEEDLSIRKLFEELIRQEEEKKYGKSSKDFNKEWKEMTSILMTQNFLWIIKTDPDLDESIMHELQQLLEPYPNFYLIGSNNNFGVGSKHGSWRDGQAGDSILNQGVDTNDNRIYSGDIRLLKLAHEYREDRVVIETRLDADDGLDKHYLSTIQNQAMKTLGPDVVGMGGENDMKWKYWCASEHVEWFSGSTPFTNSEPGVLHKPHSSGECITPGISLAMAVGVEEEEVQRYSHQKLVNMIWREGNCGAKESKLCLEFLEKEGNFVNGETQEEVVISGILAIRARTPTSAGMKNIEMKSGSTTGEIHRVDESHSSLWWNALKLNFGLKQEEAESANSYIQGNLRDIAIDNIRGQGTEGHSSKISSKDKLQAMVDILMGDERLIDQPKAFT